MGLNQHVVEKVRLVEAVLQAAAVGEKYVTVNIEHLVVKQLGGENLVVVDCCLPLLHYNAAVMVSVKVQFESLVLKVFNHFDVGHFKVTDAQLKHF